MESRSSASKYVAGSIILTAVLILLKTLFITFTWESLSTAPLPSVSASPPPSPSSIFAELWKNRMEIASDSTSDSSRVYRGGESQNSYPFGVGQPFPKWLNASRTKIDGKSLRIISPDRRKHRIPLAIKSIRNDIFKDDADPDTEWEVVFGIPSTDTEMGVRRRYIQRNTFFRYRTVWNVNKEKGSKMVIKYLLAFHPSQDYKISQKLTKEGSEHKDIIFFNIKEGRKASGTEKLFENKPIGMLAAMSQKTYAWFNYAVDRFKTNYILKGDDDAFYRCDFIVSELGSYRLPRIYYGRGANYHGIFRTSGMLIGLSYDLADWVRDSMVAENLTSYAFEDVQVGVWFALGGVPISPVSDCRHHDVKGHYSLQQPITDTSMALHHLPPNFEAFQKLFDRFSNSPHSPPTVLTEIPKGTIHWVERESCPREKESLKKTGQFIKWPVVPFIT